MPYDICVPAAGKPSVQSVQSLMLVSLLAHLCQEQVGDWLAAT